MVGCVLVRDGQWLAEGFHGRFGGPHAERTALASLNGQSARGATAYVTLEPCCHHGKTPPCTDALIEAGIVRVVCAMRDPFARMQGKGFEQLRLAGIEVDVGCGEDQAREIVAPYLKRLATGLPFVVAKWAMSLDGKMATHTGDSRWISSATSRQHAHEVRGRMDAIVVGSRTARIDDPLLTARPPGPRTPLRVVIDSEASLPPESQLAQSARENTVIVWASHAAAHQRVERLEQLGVQVLCPNALEDGSQQPHDRLTPLLKLLHQQHAATNVLFEGGGELLGHLFDGDLIDEVQVYIAPKLIGGAGACSPLSAQGHSEVASGPAMIVCEHRQLDCDTYVRSRVRRSL